MDRLTKRIEDENTLLTEVGDTACKCFCDNYTLSGCWECPVGKAIEKLADYEEAEEQGLLVRLPCPIGTTVWDICGMDIRENVLSGIECGKDGKQFLWANHDEWLGELNDLVFLTREEAVNKLEEMKNDKI